MNAICKFNEPSCYGAKELEILLDLSSMLSNKDINLDLVISILAEHLKAERILLTILNRETSTITIEATYGLNKKESKNNKTSESM